MAQGSIFCRILATLSEADAELTGLARMQPPPSGESLVVCFN